MRGRVIASRIPRAYALRLPHVALHRSFVSFVVVGGIATAIQYTWLTALVLIFGIAPTPASASGFGVSLFINYALNRRHTFESGRAHRQAMPRFVVVASSGLALNTVLVWSLTVLLHQHFMLAQIVATSVVLLWNFALHRRWTFADTR